MGIAHGRPITRAAAHLTARPSGGTIKPNRQGHRPGKESAMKIRETINSNVEKFSAVVYEDHNKIVVVKHETSNYYDRSTDERFMFETESEYRAWIAEQNWINPQKVKKVSAFRAV